MVIFEYVGVDPSKWNGTNNNKKERCLCYNVSICLPFHPLQWAVLRLERFFLACIIKTENEKRITI